MPTVLQESGLSQATWERLHGGVQAAAAAAVDGSDSSSAMEATDFGRHVVLGAGQVLHEADEGCRHFYVLLEVGGLPHLDSCWAPRAGMYKRTALHVLSCAQTVLQ